MASGSSSGKRKRVVLLIDDKVDIIGMIDRGSLLTEKFGIAKSTASDIKKSKGKIFAFKSDMAGMGMSQGDQTRSRCHMTLIAFQAACSVYTHVHAKAAASLASVYSALPSS